MATFLPEGAKPLHELFLLWGDERLANISSKRPNVSAEQSQVEEWRKAEKAETDAAFLEFQSALESEEIRVFFYRDDPPRRLYVTGDEIAGSNFFGHIFSGEKVFAFHDEKLFRHDNEQPLSDEAEFQEWLVRWRRNTNTPKARSTLNPELPKRIRGYAEADQKQITDMRNLIAREKISDTQAALRVAPEARGGGTTESKASRLLRRYRQG